MAQVATVCERCESGIGRHTATTPVPDMETLEEWSFDGLCEATDGCEVESDGKCEHNHSSWMIILGFI